MLLFKIQGIESPTKPSLADPDAADWDKKVGGCSLRIGHWGSMGRIVGTQSLMVAVRTRTSPPTGSPEAVARPRLGRIEARTGLRMMPTFPRSPYHSVRRVCPDTAGRLAFRWGLPGCHTNLSLLPTSAAC